MDLAVSLPKIESLISSHLLGKKKVALLDKYINLSNRVAEAKFYLAVVGEFSSGKSTFINALLRKRLLKEVVNIRHKYIIKELKQLCSDHIRKYGGDVELIIQKHKEQEAILSKKIKTTHKDINYLEDCEENVNSILVELKYS